MKSGYDVASYAEAFDAHNEFTGAVQPSGLAAEFRGICEDADAEIEALKIRAATAEEKLFKQNDALQKIDARLGELVILASGLKTYQNGLSGVDWIAQERRRQIEVEGWTQEHDVQQHALGELAKAASYYCAHGTQGWTLAHLFPESWDARWAKRKGFPTPTMRDLIKGGGLIAAEIDRRLYEIFHNAPSPLTTLQGR